MTQPSRRQHERFSCDIAVTIVSAASAATIGQGRIVDLCVGGAQLETPSRLQRGVAYELFFVSGKQKVRLPARVARDGKDNERRSHARLYGMVFTLTRAQESLLRLVIDALRLRSSDDDPPPVRDYWSV